MTIKQTKRPPHRKFTTVDYIANLFSAKESRISTIAAITLSSFLIQVITWILALLGVIVDTPSWANSNVQNGMYALAGMNALSYGLNYMGYGTQDPMMNNINYNQTQSVNNEEGDC